MAEPGTQQRSESLEGILNGLGKDARQRLITELLKPTIRPRDVIQGYRYLKEDLAPNIVSRLQEDSVNFRSVGGPNGFQESLYASVNKEPMKRVYYGQINARVPEVMRELPPWMAFYFNAGIWSRKSTPIIHKRFIANNLRDQPTYKIVRDTILEGIRTVVRVHRRFHERGLYRHPLTTTPHQKEVAANLPEPTSKYYGQPALPFSA